MRRGNKKRKQFNIKYRYCKQTVTAYQHTKGHLVPQLLVYWEKWNIHNIIAMSSKHTRTLQLSENLCSLKQMICHLGIWLDTTNEVCSLKQFRCTNNQTINQSLCHSSTAALSYTRTGVRSDEKPGFQTLRENVMVSDIPDTGAATAKALLPTVESLTGITIGQLERLN